MEKGSDLVLTQRLKVSTLRNLTCTVSGLVAALAQTTCQSGALDCG